MKTEGKENLKTAIDKLTTGIKWLLDECKNYVVMKEVPESGWLKYTQKSLRIRLKGVQTAFEELENDLEYRDKKGHKEQESKTNKIKITKEMLEGKGFLGYEVEAFVEVFPDGAVFPDDLEKASKAGLDLRWFFEAFKLSGECVTYRKNGQKWTVHTYENGERRRYQLWHENGQPMEDRIYKNNNLHGRCQRWHDNGQQMEDCTYENGEMHGRFQFWHENGQKLTDCTYKHDKRHGRYQSWHENGQKREDSVWEDGKIIEE